MEESTNDGLDTSFRSIRRNLNFLACLMIILAFGQAKLTKLSFLDIEIELADYRFYTLLWVAIAYFTLRYFQYLEWRRFNIELVKWRWYYFNSIARTREEDQRSIDLYFKRIVDEDIERTNYELKFPEMKPKVSSKEVNIKFKMPAGSKTIELKIPMHLYLSRRELLIKQLQFSINSNWFFTLYLPLILILLILIISISSNEWNGNPIEIFDYWF